MMNAVFCIPLILLSHRSRTKGVMERMFFLIAGLRAPNSRHRTRYLSLCIWMISAKYISFPSGAVFHREWQRPGCIAPFECGFRSSLYKNLSSPQFSSQRSSSDKLAMQYQLGALAACTAVFVYVLLRRHRKPSAIRDVPGPVNPSWIFGTFPKGQSEPFHHL